MRVRLAYGSDGLDVELPEGRTTVVTPVARPAAPDPAALLRGALREPVAGPPLRELARPGQRVAISICDGTRAAAPRPVSRRCSTSSTGSSTPTTSLVLVATGTHRGNTEAELRAMLGDGRTTACAWSTTTPATARRSSGAGCTATACRCG